MIFHLNNLVPVLILRPCLGSGIVFKVEIPKEQPKRISYQPNLRLTRFKPPHRSFKVPENTDTRYQTAISAGIESVWVKKD